MQTDIKQAETVLDTASLAAEQIAGAAGLKDPEALAQAVQMLTQKVNAFETLVPQLLQAKEDAEKALAIIEDTLPPDFKAKLSVWADDVSKVVAHVKKHFSLTF